MSDPCTSTAYGTPNRFDSHHAAGADVRLGHRIQSGRSLRMRRAPSRTACSRKRGMPFLDARATSTLPAASRAPSGRAAASTATWWPSECNPSATCSATTSMPPTTGG